MRQKGYGDLGTGQSFWRVGSVIEDRTRVQLKRSGTNVAKRGDFTFCLIHDFNSLRVAGTTTERVGLLTLADSTERFDPIALRSLGLARRNSFELLVKIIAARSHLLINVVVPKFASLNLRVVMCAIVRVR